MYLKFCDSLDCYKILPSIGRDGIRVLYVSELSSSLI